MTTYGKVLATLSSQEKIIVEQVPNLYYCFDQESSLLFFSEDIFDQERKGGWPKFFHEIFFSDDLSSTIESELPDTQEKYDTFVLSPHHQGWKNSPGLTDERVAINKLRDDVRKLIQSGLKYSPDALDQSQVQLILEYLKQKNEIWCEDFRNPYDSYSSGLGFFHSRGEFSCGWKFCHDSGQESSGDVFFKGTEERFKKWLSKLSLFQLSLVSTSTPLVYVAKHKINDGFVSKLQEII